MNMNYDDLTQMGKLRRIGRLAGITVREAYALDVAQVRLYVFATNPLYVVKTETGEKYILRMGYPGWRSYRDLLSEAIWLEELDSSTDIGAPRPIRTADGGLVVKATGHGVPYTWNATLFTWIQGRLLEYYLTPLNLRKFGRLFARLHVQGSQWTPPEGFTQRRFDSYLSRDEPDLLFSDTVLDKFCEEDRNALIQTRELVQQHYEDLDSSDLRIIHCDLWHENVKLDRGKLRPFDFEDTVWGFRLHDIAMGMLDLQETVGNERYRMLLEHFREGYCSILDWPEGRVEVLQMGRMLWMANWHARFNPSGLNSKVANYAAVFRNYSATGQLELIDE